MPLVISGDVVLGETSESLDVALGLDHPRILYDDIIRIATSVEASSEQVGFEVENALDYLTWDFWKPTTAPSTTPATITVTLDEAAPVDYVLLAAHTLGSTGNSVTISYWDGAAWVVIDEASPGSDKVLVFLFNEAFSNKYQLKIQGGSIPSVGVFMLGKALAVERKLYKGHIPITLSKRTVRLPNKSEGGQWLGTSIRREGAGTTITFSNLSSDWVRAKLEPFIEAARTYPFGWVWRPEDFPAEVAYCTTTDDIRPLNSGPRDKMSVSFSVDGILE